MEETYKHKGQVRYTAKEYIRVINSYHYNEMCVFKPKNYLQVCIDKSLFSILLYRATLNRNNQSCFANNIRRTALHSERHYVLVFGKDNVFENKRFQHSLRRERELHNYDLTKFIKLHLSKDDLQSLLDHYLRTKPITTVSTYNQALIKMLGLRFREW